MKAGEVYRDQKSFDVVVWGIPKLRTDLSALRRLPIETPLGGYVALGDVAEVQVVPAPNEIKREHASRRIDVTCNVKGRDLGSVAREIQALVSNPEKVKFDRGYHPEFLGEYAARAASQRRLFALAGMSLVGIFLLLQLDFRSWKLAILVVLTIPFALVGGVAGTVLQGGVLSLGSLVGFVTVLGIAARNGIMLVSHYRHLEEVEGEEFGAELVMRGSEERLAPILMTALATGLALVPLIIGGNKPGHEIEYPMAVVILGGLLTSTILNLFLLPPLYARWGRIARSAEDVVGDSARVVTIESAPAA
jgi:Cu/Ag efflux pump CusA